MTLQRKPFYCGTQNYIKVVVCLVVVIILLQGFHMIVLMRIQETATANLMSASGISHQNRAIRNITKINNKPKIDVTKIINQIMQASIMDTSGMYMLIPNLIKPDKSESVINTSVSICTQTTSSHLHYLIDLSTMWRGPISVTVFTYGLDTPLAVYTILLLYHCTPSVQDHVHFHLAHPISHPPLRLKSLLSKSFDCSNIYKTKINTGKNYEIPDLPYPHNVLRNTAIMFTESPYIMMIDIDFVLSANLKQQLQTFIQRHYSSLESSKSSEQTPRAFVIPSFESKLHNLTELSKADLIKEWDKGNIRSFYYDICWKCQKVTDYDRWKSLPAVSFMEVGYNLDWADPWEPFYMARKSDLPLYDGRFKQYGFNRISQICEMHITGFKFAVMNNAFIIHRGYKQVETFHDKKQEENLKNKELFRAFKTELKDRYPHSKMEC